MTETRQLDPEATRQAILDAADELFVQSGFDGVSLSQIARRAEVTKSLIHHHFGSKRSLWDSVKSRRFEGFARSQQAIIDAIGTDIDSFSAIGATIRTQFLHRNSDPALGRLMSWAHLAGQSSDMRVMGGVLRSGVERIAAAQEAGEFRDDVPAVLILHAMLGSVHSWFMYREIFESAGLLDPELGSDQFVEGMAALMTRGVSPED